VTSLLLDTAIECALRVLKAHSTVAMSNEADVLGLPSSVGFGSWLR
jgi:hypothetical protein